MRQQSRGEYRGYRNAGIRMSEELDSAFVRDREDAERASLAAFHMFDKAHNVMLAEERIVPADVGVAILQGLRDLEAEPGGAVEARARVGGGMHSGEMYLIRTLGEEIGGWDHVGRSSACLAVVARRIEQRDGLLDLMDSLIGFRRALLELAKRHLDSPVPGYFGTQVVQPTSFGHYLMGSAQGLERHAERVREAFRRANCYPGGGVVLSGTAFPINRERVADLLGFDGVVVNTADAVAGNDTAIECFGVLAMLAQQVERLSNDMDRWFASENRFIAVPDRFIAASSVAMQMKTPIPIGRGITFDTAGEFVKAFSQSGTSGAINPGAALQAMAGTLQGFTRLVSSIRLDRARALNAAQTLGNAGATDLGVLLVTARRLPWRTAHQICGIMFRLCDERGLATKDIDGRLLDEAAVEYNGQPLGISTPEIQAAMDPVHILASRQHTGGTALEQAVVQHEALAAAVGTDETWVSERRRRIAAAATALENAIDVLTGIM